MWEGVTKAWIDDKLIWIAPGWLPMDSAPKDGTPILGLLRGQSSKDEAVRIAIRWHGEEGFGWVWAWGQWPDEEWEVDPILWAPLLGPPEA